MSGRGLGHTGGTVDKLESIPGFRTSLDSDEFISIVNECGICVTGQSGKLCPADKKLYALRDVTATVDNVSLIASSIMSKKLAGGAECIVLDVKCGSGAFMKDEESATILAEKMVEIGRGAGRKIAALITDMDVPLGHNIGNSLEIIESIEFLKGNIKKGDLAELTYSFATIALMQLGLYNDKSEAEAYLKELVSSGKAIEKFKELIIAQNGNPEVIDNYDLFDLPTYKIECESKKNGYVHNIDAYKIAYACKILGAGRDKKSDPIDYSVGIYLNKKSGDNVNKGDILYTIYSNNPEKTMLAQKYCDEAFVINENRPYHNSLIYKIIRASEDDDV